MVGFNSLGKMRELGICDEEKVDENEMVHQSI